MAAYLLLLQEGINTHIYSGSAMARSVGFRLRKSNYDKLTYRTMPNFIKKLLADQKEFQILLILPIQRIYLHEANDILFGDLRNPILLIETVMMVWFRCFKKGGAYEKFMKYSPWAEDEVCFIRSNKLTSTFMDWPRDLKASTLSRNEKSMIYYENHKEARKSAMAIYNKSEKGKAAQQKADKKRAGTEKKEGAEAKVCTIRKGEVSEQEGKPEVFKIRKRKGGMEEGRGQEKERKGSKG